MAADLHGFTEQETLNKVLNTSNDSLQVDIVDATGVTITTSTESVYVDGATWTDDESSHTLLGGIYQSTPQTIADGKTGPLQVDADGALHISDGGNTITVDGTVTVSGLLADGHAVTIDNTDSNEVYVRGSGTAGSPDAKVLTVQGIGSGTAQPVSGTFWQSTQPVSLASVPTHAVTISDTSFAVADGSALGEGVLVQGDDGSDRKNIHVDATTGDVQVDVTDIVPGVAATSLGKAIQSAQGSTDTGVTALVVRNDVLADLSGADGDYAPLQVDKSGALYTIEETGQLGSLFEDGTDNITSKQIIAIQFLEDTTFTTLTPSGSNLYIGTANQDGDAIDTSNVFPQGMTIFGRWTGYRLASGTIIAYKGTF
jgi:hypothetical protein